MNLESTDSTLEIPHSKPLICLHYLNVNLVYKSMMIFEYILFFQIFANVFCGSKTEFDYKQKF